MRSPSHQSRRMRTVLRRSRSLRRSPPMVCTSPKDLAAARRASSALMPCSMNSRVRISMWNASSSSTSRLASGRLSERRKDFLDMGSSSAGGERAGDRARELFPALSLGAQLRASERREGVVLGLASGLGRAPLLGEPAFALEAMKRGVESALLDDEDVGGGLADPAADRVAVAWSPGDSFEDEEVERAGVEVGASHRCVTSLA